jgi:sugar lactone lactonase YvrE
MRRVKTNRMLFTAVAATAFVGLSTAPSVSAATAATHPLGLTSNAPVTVVATGLSGPRALAWGPHHQLLVSEAGVPSTVCAGSSVPPECFSTTGSIADISSGEAVPVVTGLVSALNDEEVVGPDGLAYVNGQLYTLEAGAPQLIPSGLPTGLTAALDTQSGALLNVTGGHISVVANPGEVDYAWSQAHENLASDFPDADPYALTANPRGGFYLADAASNTLDTVNRWGHVQVLAFFPPSPSGSDAVPSCVAVGPDGAVYVGQLTGNGNSGTAANVYRYAPWSHRLTVWQSGFSAINGCGFGANGNFYVTELDTTGFLPTGPPAGAVIQISPDGTRTVLGAGNLLFPTGFLAGPDGSIYVGNDSIIWPVGPGTSSPVSSGEVVKIG